MMPSRPETVMVSYGYWVEDLVLRSKTSLNDGTAEASSATRIALLC